MDVFLGLLGLVFLFCPIIALIVALKLRSKVAGLETMIDRLKSEVVRLRADIDAGGPPSAAVGVAASLAGAAPAAPGLQPASAPAPANAADQNHGTGSAEALIARSGSPVASHSAPPPAARIEPAPPSVPFAPAAPPASPAQRAPQPGFFDAPWAGKAKAWLFSGNLVAKIGLLILFFGVSFLLKYVAAQITVPIELRLAGVATGAIALLLWAWRIRTRRPGISLPVQGAALAILMLVTFGAFRLFHLIPSGMAFGLLFVLTAFTCLLAVLQNALWLAVFGIAGGFASPILTSTGAGSHIALFSYYALLNAGVFAIALMRSWRLLNLVAFVFTFVIGTSWGVLRYQPENYLSAQGFLILFFLFYVAIAVLYARRQAPQLKHTVDATLVFGTPLLAFGLQFALVRETPFGAAFSALGLGLFYTLLTLLLWRRRDATLKLLVESFLALGIVFGTLTIPFALDGRWTSAAWALEGAAIVWMGLRQRQTMVWLFGLLVQAGAWLSFLGSVGGLDPVAARHSNLWLGFLLLAGTAFLMAANFRTQATQAPDSMQPGQSRFNPIATVFLALAAIWFVAGAWAEIFLHTSGARQATLLVASALLAAFGLALVASRMQWQIARYFAVAVQIVAGLTLLGLALTTLDWPAHVASPNLLDGPFLGALLIGAGAFFSSRVFQQQEAADAGATESVPANQPARARRLSRSLLLWSGFWWYGLVLYELTAWSAIHTQLWSGAANADLGGTAYAIGLALSALLFARLARRLAWDDLRWSALPGWFALAIWSLGLMAMLYGDKQMPAARVWLGYAALWLAGEWLMRFWPNNPGWRFGPGWLKWLHLVRTAGPWLMIWPAGGHWIARWLHAGTAEQDQLLADAGWFTSGSWSRYLPAWLMMAVVGWLMQRSNAGGWPVAPIADWYRRRLIPLAALWSIMLVALWNLTQNGAMAPLPYLPLLNPLDISTCFAILLGYATYRNLALHPAGGVKAMPAAWLSRLPLIAGLAAYGWFNLMLLRSVAHYSGIPYQIDSLFASQFVQAMLSLVWSATALVLMRRAVRQSARRQWMLGAGLLALVVAKLFLVDLSNVGGIERIVSFVGVGLLMVAIGYLAPYPAEVKNQPRPGHDTATPA